MPNRTHSALARAVLVASLLAGTAALAQAATDAPRSSIVETIKAVKDKITGTPAPASAPLPAAPSKQPTVLLRLHGSAELGASFIPKLAQSLLAQRGHRSIDLVNTGPDAIHVVGRGGLDNPLEAIEIKTPGSGAAFAESLAFKQVGLEKKFADIGLSSRPIRPDEAAKLRAVGLGEPTSPQAEHIIGLDGVAFFTHPSNPIAGLSLEELRRIYRHEVADWREVHGVDASGKPITGKAGPITVYCDHCRPGEGAYDFVKQKVFADAIDLDLAAPYLKVTDSYQSTQQALAADPNGIGYGSIIFQSSASKPLRLSRGGAFVEADAFHLKNGDYPLTRNLYLYTHEKKTPLELQFIKLAYSPAGQQLLEQSGLVSTLPSKQTDAQADSQKDRLLHDPKIPDTYKTLIRDADRSETPYNLRFESGTGQLDNKSLIDLGRLVQTLQEPRHKNATVILAGFSDSRGEAAVNLKLSSERAQFVEAVLRTQGVTRIETAGFGEETALLLNPQENTADALKENRRVEVWLRRGS